MNKRRWLLTLAACLLVFAALAGYKYMQIRAAIAFGESYPEPSATVEALTASSYTSETSVTTIGELIAPQSIELRNELEGRISYVGFRSGAEVSSGAILLQLDTREEQARLKAAEARANLARLDLERAKKLLANNTVSQERVDQAAAEFDVARANIRELEAIIDKKTIRAPFNARTGLHQLEVGEFLESNSHITTLVGLNDFSWVDFSLPVTYRSVGPGTPVRVTLPGETAASIDGQVIAIDATVSASTRSRRFRARLEQAGLPPNSLANVEVIIGTSDKVQIPVTAVQHDVLGTYVYRLEPDEHTNAYRARRQAIVLGREDRQTVVVESGLSAGQLIATQGSFKLRSGLLTYVSERKIGERKPPSQPRLGGG